MHRNAKTFLFLNHQIDPLYFVVMFASFSASVKLRYGKSTHDLSSFVATYAPLNDLLVFSVLTIAPTSSLNASAVAAMPLGASLARFKQSVLASLLSTVAPSVVASIPFSPHMKNVSRFESIALGASVTVVVDSDNNGFDIAHSPCTKQPWFS